MWLFFSRRILNKFNDRWSKGFGRFLCNVQNRIHLMRANVWLCEWVSVWWCEKKKSYLKNLNEPDKSEFKSMPKLKNESHIGLVFRFNGVSFIRFGIFQYDLNFKRQTGKWNRIKKNRLNDKISRFVLLPRPQNIQFVYFT